MSRRGFDGPRSEQGRRPGGKRFEGKRPGAGRPGAKRFEGKRPESGRPGANRFEGKRPEGGRPGANRFEGKRPEGGRPGANRFEGKRPEGGRPGAKRFEGARPEGARPGAKRFEGKRPESARPGARRYEGKGYEGKRPGGKRFEAPPRPGDTRFESRRPEGRQAETTRAERLPAERAARLPPEDGCIWGLIPVLEYLRGKPKEVERLLLAEGALDRGPAAEVLSRAREAGIHVERVDRERLNRLSGNGVHQGIVAEVSQYEYVELSVLSQRARASGRHPLLVVLDGVQDPHNLGAIIRSAHALGAHGVVVGKDRAAQVTGSVVKAAAGALAHCPVGRVTNIARAIEQLRDEGFWSVVLSPEGGSPLFDLKLDGPLVLVIGSEGEGVRQLVASKCDFRATIPMEGRIASLNASVSAAIALYEISRQRLAAAPVEPPKV